MPGSYSIRSTINLVMFGMKNNKEKPKNGIVRLPFGLLLLSLVGSAISVLIWAFEAQEKKLIMLLFLIPSVMLGLYALIWRIRYDDSQFTCRNLLFHSRTYRYTEITAVKKDREDTILYVGKKKIRVPIEAVGAPAFLKIVRRYKKKN